MKKNYFISVDAEKLRICIQFLFESLQSLEV